MPSFRLDQEAWIPVVDSDGVERSLSLKEVFEQVGNLAAIGGSPVEVASLTRLLLAIAHLTDTPTNFAEWRTRWKDRVAFARRCGDYVDQVRPTWDLLDPALPFGQVPEQAKTENPVHLLVYEAARKNNAVHLDHSVESEPTSVPMATLARGLLTANSFAGSSGGGYLAGPLCMRSVAFLQGGTLSETLVLNLLVQKSKPEEYDWRNFGRMNSQSPLDLPRRYLWASRKTRIVQEPDGTIRRVTLAPGDKIKDEDLSRDPMVAMRKDAAGKQFVPLRLDAGRALWRNAHVLLTWHEDGRPLACVRQLSDLAFQRGVPDQLQVALRVCSVAGDAQGPTTEMWRDETLSFSISVLHDEQRFADLRKAIDAAEGAADTTRKRIYGFALRYLQGTSDKKPDKADIVRLADELGGDLSDYWADLAPAGERIACDDFDEDHWGSLVKASAESAYQKAIGRLPADARRFRAEYVSR